MKILFQILFFTSFMMADTQTVAISYFDNTSGLEEYNPLSKGLADMLITDLSNVKSIQIVEREKLESLLKEIELGESKFMDESTAQKLGKGLGAGYILTGSYLIMGETMRIDARLVNVGTGEVSMGEEITGEKSAFFELEKDLVKKLISALNLTLSKSEERRVNKVQTESFDSFNAYSASLDSYDKGEYEESQAYLEKAVEIDGDFEIAWDKLDALQEQLEQLLAAREMELSTETIKIMDDLIKNDKNSCETFLYMYDNKASYLKRHLWDDKKYDGTLYDENHKKDIIKAFNEFVNIYEYMDFKKYPLDLCDDINSERKLTNPYRYIWEISRYHSIELLLVKILKFENYNDDRIVIENNKKEKDIKTVIDEMIILYEQKLIKAFPNRSALHSERSLKAVKLAINRKQNPDIYNAYRWIEKKGGRLSWYFNYQHIWGTVRDIERIYFRQTVDIPSDKLSKELNLIPDLKRVVAGAEIIWSKEEAEAAMSRTADDWAKLDSEKEQQQETVKAVRNKIGESCFIGPKTAKITIVAWIDFQDYYSAKVPELFNSLLRKYPEDIKIVIKNYPLPHHKQAKKAAFYSMAADRQGKYWEMFNKIFINYQKLVSNEDLPYQYAQELGLDMDQLEKDMQDPILETNLNQEMNQMKNAGFDRISVPKILINGTEPEGGRSLENYSKIIDAELKK